MALGKHLGSGGGGYTPKYITTGLTLYPGRCVINDGGYYIDSNNIVHIDITITFISYLDSNNPYLLVRDFPMANTAVPSSGVTIVTGTYNKLAMGVSYYGDTVLLINRYEAGQGDTCHFIGSYQMKVV